MIRALIFDLDGTISDTETLHAESESKLLAGYDIKISHDEITQRFSGVRPTEYFTILFKENNKHADIGKVMKEKWQLAIEFAKKGVKPTKGAVQLIRDLKAHNLKLAVASSSLKEFVDIVLEELGITDCFDIITYGADVKRGKPDPDIFQLAAKRLKIKPSECIVIEDSLNGMTAAKRAGMKCIGLKENYNPNRTPADLIVKNLSELTYEKIISM